jgi:stage IV sporulation protein FB
MIIFFAVASIIAHEWAHIFAVRFMGAKTERVGFFPLGMMAKIRGLENLHSWERYVIFAAGSLANFAIALWAGATSRLSYVGVGRLDELAFCNFALGVFNLMPAMPLDGGRIVWQFLSNRIGILRASRFIIRVGIFIGCAFIALGIVQVFLFPYNITLLCAGIFILKKNKTIAPELQAAFHTALDGKNSPSRARTLPVKEVAISPETSIKNALEYLTGDYFTTFCVTKKNSTPVRIREQALIKHIFSKGINGTVGDLSGALKIQKNARDMKT